MTIIDLLKEYYEREMNNVFYYSATYLMNTPKRGYETEWAEAKVRAELLRHELKQKGVEV